MMKKSGLIGWDIASLTGVFIYNNVQMPDSYSLIVGISTVTMLTNCVKNHMNAYKLSGKIY